MATTYPSAAPGFGKRTAPSQSPRSASDFAHLPEREAYLAQFIDRLPEGAAIDIKTLAREQPRYGQQAVRKALTALCEAGHLWRELEKVGDGVTRWVRRTFFSRTPRTESWWKSLVNSRRTGGTTPPEPGPPPRSEAYRALAELGNANAKLMLSAKDCEALEPLAAEWFARRVSLEQFLHVLTNNLPHSVSAPGPFVRKRLVDKIPPEPPAAPATIPRCAGCRAPVAHSSALCPRCLSTPKAVAEPPGVRARLIAEVRAVARTARERGGRERGGRERTGRQRGGGP
ncbi:hypothetical protein [Kitasatospora acidiphila]|uniref:hypothetical protein n=1 Tax=Kitasatospora acidiphila TaxID=2567942 RepID=UPI003C707DE0